MKVLFVSVSNWPVLILVFQFLFHISFTVADDSLSIDRGYLGPFVSLVDG